MIKFVAPTRFEFGALPLFRISSFALRHLVTRFRISYFWPAHGDRRLHAQELSVAPVGCRLCRVAVDDEQLHQGDEMLSEGG
jgi:hypothetical protein